MRLGLSESARATAAEESRFRVDYPNSKPRSSRVIALDARGFALLLALKDRAWNGARFLRYVKAKPASEHLPSLSVDAVLQDAEGLETSLIREVMDADIVVMVMVSGTMPAAAEIIGNACFMCGKMSTGLVLTSGEDDAESAATIQALRPFAAMLVVSQGEDYVGEMLTALRA